MKNTVKEETKHQYIKKISKRKWTLTGNTLKKQNSVEEEILGWNPQGRKKRGRVHELIEINKIWREIK